MLQTRLFQQGRLLREEIARHKWFESEKAGYDIGWVRAMTNWLVRQQCRQAVELEQEKGSVRL